MIFKLVVFFSYVFDVVGSLEGLGFGIVFILCFYLILFVG